MFFLSNVFKKSYSFPYIVINCYAIIVLVFTFCPTTFFPHAWAIMVEMAKY